VPPDLIRRDNDIPLNRFYNSIAIAYLDDFYAILFHQREGEYGAGEFARRRTFLFFANQFI
jgi:hypothetical protein